MEMAKSPNSERTCVLTKTVSMTEPDSSSYEYVIKTAGDTELYRFKCEEVLQVLLGNKAIVIIYKDHVMFDTTSGSGSGNSVVRYRYSLDDHIMCHRFNWDETEVLIGTVRGNIIIISVHDPAGGTNSDPSTNSGQIRTLFTVASNQAPIEFTERTLITETISHPMTRRGVYRVVYNVWTGEVISTEKVEEKE
jgi:hypothetical protein